MKEKFIKKINSKVRTADGSRRNIVCVISLNIFYKNETKPIEFYIIPTLVQNVYLGVNFWKALGMATNMVSDVDVHETHLKGYFFTSEQRKRLQATISGLPKFEEQGFGKTSLVEHIIDVGDAKPIKQRHFPILPAIEKLMCKEVDRILTLGVIEESNSPWSSPVVLVRKPGKVCLCLNSRKVNALTVKDVGEDPHIEGILSRLPRQEFTSSLDLKYAFWQIPLGRKLRIFFGAAGWYREFVANFAKKTHPLTELWVKSKSFEWSDESQKSFDSIKTRLTQTKNTKN